MIRQIRHLRLLNITSWRTSSSHKNCVQFSLEKSRSHHLLTSCKNNKLLSQNMKSLPASIQQTWRLGQSELNSWSMKITRTFMYRKIFKKKPASQLQKEDGIESHYSLVYEGNAASYALWAYGIVETIGFSLLLTIPFISFNSTFFESVFHEFFSEFYEFGIFCAVNSVICLWVARTCVSYALRIYYSDLEDKFIILFMGYHPLAMKKVTVNPGEIKPVIPGSLKQSCIPWANDIYSLSRKKMIMSLDGFRSPLYYNKLVGY